jgi:hypothetical protein
MFSGAHDPLFPCCGNFQYTKCTSYRTFSRVCNIHTDYFTYKEATEISQMQLSGEADVSDIIRVNLLSIIYTLQHCLCLSADGKVYLFITGCYTTCVLGSVWINKQEKKTVVCHTFAQLLPSSGMNDLCSAVHTVGLQWFIVTNITQSS